MLNYCFFYQQEVIPNILRTFIYLLLTDSPAEENRD